MFRYNQKERWKKCDSDEEGNKKTERTTKTIGNISERGEKKGDMFN